MRYVREFDTLRAAAVTLVVISHAFPNTPTIHILPLGMIGVTFFFVLSGYLISGILFKAKKRNSESGNWHDLMVFYLRRALRIFPAYYLFLFINYLFKNPEFLNNPSWFLLYLQNILFFTTGQYAGVLSPTWTLAVEEQFYLFWPIVILFAPERHMKKVIACFILFSPIFRILVAGAGHLVHQNVSLNLSLMPSNLVSLASGAFLAWYQFQQRPINQKLQSGKIPIIVIAGTVTLSFIIKWSFLFSLITQFSITMVSLWAIQIITVRNVNDPIRWLSQSVTIYIGKISYGVYLYHTVAVAIFLKIINRPISFIRTGYDFIDFVLEYSIVLLIASFSWYLFERPLNNAKRFFKY